MIYHLKSPLIVSIAFFLLQSCATNLVVTGLTDLPQLPPTASGVVLPVSLETENAVIGTSGCKLVLRPEGDIGTLEINFKPVDDVLFAKLPVGTYIFKEVVCGGYHLDLIGRNWADFRVYKDSISLLAGFSMKVGEGKKIYMKLNDREKTRNSALKVFGRIPAESRGRIVSAYTGKSVSALDVEKEPRWKDWELKDIADRPLKNKLKDWPSFHGCYKGEGDVNPLWLGNVQLDVSYVNGDLYQLNLENKWNTFTDQFLNCIKATLKEYHPKEVARIKYVLYI